MENSRISNIIYTMQIILEGFKTDLANIVEQLQEGPNPLMVEASSALDFGEHEEPPPQIQPPPRSKQEMKDIAKENNDLQDQVNEEKLTVLFNPKTRTFFNIEKLDTLDEKYKEYNMNCGMEYRKDPNTVVLKPLGKGSGVKVDLSNITLDGTPEDLERIEKAGALLNQEEYFGIRSVIGQLTKEQAKEYEDSLAADGEEFTLSEETFTFIGRGGRGVSMAEDINRLEGESTEVKKAPPEDLLKTVTEFNELMGEKEENEQKVRELKDIIDNFLYDNETTTKNDEWYKIKTDGTSEGTQLYCNDKLIRGIQSVSFQVNIGMAHTRLTYEQISTTRVGAITKKKVSIDNPDIELINKTVVPVEKIFNIDNNPDIS